MSDVKSRILGIFWGLPTGLSIAFMANGYGIISALFACTSIIVGLMIFMKMEMR